MVCTRQGGRSGARRSGAAAGALRAAASQPAVEPTEAKETRPQAHTLREKSVDLAGEVIPKEKVLECFIDPFTGNNLFSLTLVVVFSILTVSKISTSKKN